MIDAIDLMVLLMVIVPPVYCLLMVYLVSKL